MAQKKVFGPEGGFLIPVRVDKETYEKLRLAAFKTRISMSEIVRDAVKEKLAKMKM